MSKKAIIDFDHHTTKWVNDPYSVYKELQNNCPVAYSEAHGGFWLLSRYEDVKRALLDWQRFSSNHPGRIAIPNTTPQKDVPGIPIEVDPPKHTAYRNIVKDHFSKEEVNKLEPQLTRIANDLIDAFIDQNKCDIVQDYATPLLANSLALLLNLPLEDVTKLETWANAIFADRTKNPEAAKQAMQALESYINVHMASRKKNPGGDLFTSLVKAKIDGKPLSDKELLGYGRIILLAGREATIDGLANSFWYLAQHPEALEHLVKQPDLILSAVEEFLRFMSPIQLLGRVATKDLNLQDQTIQKGESVAMTYACANRDEQVFKQADKCVLNRRPNPHLAFGSGPHYCLGSHLARLDLRVGITEFIKRIPRFELSKGAERKPNGDARGFLQLPIAF